MLKVRVIPILTFNGFGLVKTKKFSNPRMLGNPVQAAKVYNSRNVDELIFLDIFATKQKRKINLKLIADVIKECYMPVGIGGGIQTIEDIQHLLKIGADKVIIKNKALTNIDFIKQSVDFFGGQCISIAVDAYASKEGYLVHNEFSKATPLDSFIKEMESCGVGEFVITSVDNDGLMEGFDTNLINEVASITNKPIVAVGGGGNLSHFKELFSTTSVEAVGSASIFHFTQFTPLDIKMELQAINIPVRL